MLLKNVHVDCFCRFLVASSLFIGRFYSVVYILMKLLNTTWLFYIKKILVFKKKIRGWTNFSRIQFFFKNSYFFQYFRSEASDASEPSGAKYFEKKIPNMVDKTSVCLCVCVSVCMSVRGLNSSVTGPILIIFGHNMCIPGTPDLFGIGKKFWP